MTLDVVNSIPSKPDFKGFEDFKLSNNELKSVAEGWEVNLFWGTICFGCGEEEDISGCCC